MLYYTRNYVEIAIDFTKLN